MMRYSLQGYYQLVHQSFSILPPPPPPSVQVSPTALEPGNESSNDVYEPSSPLPLALLSILTLSPRHGEEPHAGHQDLKTRKAVADSLA